MNRLTHHPVERAPKPAPVADHIKCLAVIELPYLLDGKRAFVATDERGWMIARGIGSTEAECQKVIANLNDALEAHRCEPRLTLVLDAS